MEQGNVEFSNIGASKDSRKGRYGRRREKKLKILDGGGEVTPAGKDGTTEAL